MPRRPPWALSEPALHQRGRRRPGRPGSVRGPVQRLLPVRLWGVGEEQPPPGGQVSLGHLQQPVGAEHAGDEAFAG